MPEPEERDALYHVSLRVGRGSRIEIDHPSHFVRIVADLTHGIDDAFAPLLASAPALRRALVEMIPFTLDCSPASPALPMTQHPDFAGPECGLCGSCMVRTAARIAIEKSRNSSR